MEILSFIVLIFLFLVGYSVGAVIKVNKFIDLKPQLIDLILVVIIWAGAIYLRITFDLKKWFLILIWVILSIIIGVLAILFRKPTKEKILAKKEPERAPKNLKDKAFDKKYFFLFCYIFDISMLYRNLIALDTFI